MVAIGSLVEDEVGVSVSLGLGVSVGAGGSVGMGVTVAVTLGSGVALMTGRVGSTVVFAALWQAASRKTHRMMPATHHLYEFATR